MSILMKLSRMLFEDKDLDDFLIIRDMYKYGCYFFQSEKESVIIWIRYALSNDSISIKIINRKNNPKRFHFIDDVINNRIFDSEKCKKHKKFSRFQKISKDELFEHGEPFKTTFYDEIMKLIINS